MKQTPKALFLSHGGGPLPLLGDSAHQEMISCLKSIAASIPKPDALVVVSAHWEEKNPTITSGQSPFLIYDYHGFSPESYQIQYPCPGEPFLASELHRMLADAGIDARQDESRGIDHGVFVPLKIMYPEANIPCVQMSLVDTLDPSHHIEIGRALKNLSRKNVLVIGSGFSFHNMRAFFTPDDEESNRLNHSFEDWLVNVCSSREIREEERAGLLIRWSKAPGARFCHPREEHLLPLHVCYGVAQSPSSEQYRTVIMNKESSLYLW
ncbi:DODA-type extradiol aromatic ring-opening family dioxygenase [Methylotuvimicrobium buryatense]|uniref:Dioxygenase n=1 Tax=Methylotuvimicrobium buryatense TaxID=95641 RepID=A0A4P9UK68_METBY|nr:class III extradiol ring-cleavage dioxygenase [Methylotuvimicrobium buryatense]QCW81427.1 dioxygenase [Methylotuvimicrobium buryatense]